MFKKEKCPICGYDIKPSRKHPALGCQCRFGGSAHPDRDKNRSVVYSHLFLLSKKQLKHIVKLQRDLYVSYEDEEKTDILERLEEESRKGVMMWLFRNKKRERELLRGPDAPYCARCGSLDIIVGHDEEWNTTSIVCPHCLWICGDVGTIEGIRLCFLFFMYGVKMKMSRWLWGRVFAGSYAECLYLWDERKEPAHYYFKLWQWNIRLPRKLGRRILQRI